VLRAGCSVLGAFVLGAVCLVHGAQSQLLPSPEGRGTALLAGRVVDADTGEPIEGVRVTLAVSQPGPTVSGGPSASAVFTDSHGRYYFAALPPGPYAPLPSREGYVPLAFGSTFRLGEGTRVTEGTLRMRRLGLITGTLRDDAGDPVVGTEVIAYKRTIQQGRIPQLTRITSDRSDDRGRYRLRNLAAGQYFVCACGRDPIPFDGPLLTTLASRPVELAGIARRAAAVGAETASLDDTLKTFGATFHPNASLASRATRVSVAPGEHKEAIDIDLTAVRSVRVSGVIFGGPASGVAAATVRLIPANDLPEASQVTQFAPMVLQPDGRFDFAGIPPGQYTLIVQYDTLMGTGGPSGSALGLLGARGRGLSQPVVGSVSDSALSRLWASEPVSVGDRDVTGLAIGLRPGFSIKGKIAYAGSPSPQTNRFITFSMAPVGVTLLPSRVGIGVGVRGEDSFAFNNIMPGRFLLVPGGFVAGGRLRSITLKGVDVTDGPIAIESSDLEGLVISLTDAPPTVIEGTTQFSPGETMEDMQVCLFPTDRRHWSDPVAAIRRFDVKRFMAPSASFSFSNMPAGEYYIAVQRAPASTVNVPSFDWLDQQVLEELARTAERVRVSDGESKAVVIRR
jgi:hypothetical protein